MDSGADNKAKYIVIVTDTSGSMGYDINDNTIKSNSDIQSKLDILKNTLLAENDGFISKFAGKNNVNVALVDYSNTAILGNDLNSANIIKNSSNVRQEFAAMGDTNQVNKLNSQIDGLTAIGGTNIGDGLRRAYWLLNNVSSSAGKYIVLMTDGTPTYYSYIGQYINFYMAMVDHSCWRTWK